VSKGTLKGNLVLVGSGDFSFGLREQKNGTLAYNNSPQIDHNYADTGLAGPALVPNSHPLAGVDQLARQVRASGIRRVTGNIAIDDRLFTPYNGWPDGLISPIWVNENVIDVTAKPTSAGRAARISYRPHTAAYRVISQVKTVNGPGKPLAVSSPRPGIVQITGQLSSKSAPILSIYHVTDPASFARTAFIEALRRAGVRVAARSTGPNPRGLLSGNRRYPAADRVALRVSPPLSEFVKVILKVSYNRGADDMVCLVAAKIGSRNCIDGLDRELTSITKLGVSPASTILFDGAGSEEFDRSSLTDYTTYLRNAARQPWGAAFHAGLPILGVDGTFAQNQRGTPAAGHVFVKSGTRAMSSPTDKQGIISALTQAGYIDAKSGRKLVYAMFLRDLPLGTDATAFETADHQQGEIAAAFWAGY
jgi:serine-type D-Ala-D-Ala carboxypeptidase/endopeptidase (penicillin-binding protein 4)